MVAINVILTMDCEPALFECSPLAIKLSGTGPATHEEGESSIRAYVETADVEGYPVTLFAHPEVAVAQTALLLELQQAGACLGMHLHPYKFDPVRYPRDLGAFTAEQQSEMISAAMKAWSDALGQHPRFFRGGVYSANDATFGVLLELGFEGGSLSVPRPGVAEGDGDLGWCGVVSSPGQSIFPPHQRRQRFHRSPNVVGHFQADGQRRTG